MKEIKEKNNKIIKIKGKLIELRAKINAYEAKKNEPKTEKLSGEIALLGQNLSSTKTKIKEISSTCRDASLDQVVKNHNESFSMSLIELQNYL